MTWGEVDLVVVGGGWCVLASLCICLRSRNRCYVDMSMNCFSISCNYVRIELHVSDGCKEL